MTVICIRHPKYDGASNPVLSCKECCRRFIAGVHERNREEAIRNGTWGMGDATGNSRATD